MSDLLINSSSNQSSTYSTSLSSSSTSSATSSSSTGNVLRLNGMATGLDVDSIVSSMMKPYQVKIDEVNQSIQKVQWKQQMYQKIISDIKDLQNTYFNVADPDNNITSPSFFNSMAATSGNTSIVSATASQDAQAGNISMQVKDLAKPAVISGNTLSTPQITVSDASNWGGGSITFNVDGADHTITLDSPSSVSNPSSLVNDINSKISQDSSLSGKVSASFITDSNGTYIRFTSNSSSVIKVSSSNISEIGTQKTITSVNGNTTLSQIGYTGSGTLYISCNNNQYKVNITGGSETLDQLSADISSETSGQVSARLDDITGQIILQTTSTGSSTSLSISGDSSLLDALKISSGTRQSATPNGSDAQIVINGETISEQSNNFTLNGVNYKLIGESTSPVNINVTSNADSVFTKFKGFMDKYNSVVSEIKGKLTEKVDYNYHPLTSAQEKQMSQSDIDLWNQKAQQGLLNNDSNLENLLQDLKDTFYNAVQGASTVFGPTTIGLDLSGDYTKDGQIVFSDSTGDKFKQLIESNPSSIASLFTQSASSDLTGNDRTNNEGIAQRINDILVSNAGMTGVVSDSSILGAMAYKQDDYSAYATSGTDTFLDQLYGYNLQITDLQTEYNNKQTQYYNEFTNLEQAMEQLNSQSSFLSQMMGGSTGA